MRVFVCNLLPFLLGGWRMRVIIPSIHLQREEQVNERE